MKGFFSSNKPRGDRDQAKQKKEDFMGDEISGVGEGRRSGIGIGLGVAPLRLELDPETNHPGQGFFGHVEYRKLTSGGKFYWGGILRLGSMSGEQKGQTPGGEPRLSRFNHHLQFSIGPLLGIYLSKHLGLRGGIEYFRQFLSSPGNLIEEVPQDCPPELGIDCSELPTQPVNTGTQGLLTEDGIAVDAEEGTIDGVRVPVGVVFDISDQVQIEFDLSYINYKANPNEGSGFASDGIETMVVLTYRPGGKKKKDPEEKLKTTEEIPIEPTPSEEPPKEEEKIEVEPEQPKTEENQNTEPEKKEDPAPQPKPKKKPWKKEKEEKGTPGPKP
jgi:hypothetical protein